MNKLNRIASFGCLVVGLAIPFMLFLNRFLIPDNSFDSINYHMFLGYRGIVQNDMELFPTGIHNFPTLLDLPNYLAYCLLGYRLGAIWSLIFVYAILVVCYAILKIYHPRLKLLSDPIVAFLLLNTIFSFELFLQIATYYTDIVVAFVMLASIYFLLLYERVGKFYTLFLSSVFMSLALFGKFTTWYLYPAYLGYLIYILLKNKQCTSKQKFLYFCGVNIMSFAILFPWLIHNYLATNNPVFPFFNSFFKSEMFPATSFNQIIFGGKSIWERLSWGISSIKVPVRLGEVHDLFTDYKINFYFVSTTFIWLYYIRDRTSTIWKLSTFYLITYLTWSLAFGYLRYALVLEVFGGLILLLFYMTIKKSRLVYIFCAVMLLMLWQDKRILNMALAYDISFRPNFYFNRNVYLQEWSNISNNKIEIPDELLMQYRPEIYLNCAAPSTTYYVLSNVNTLPVLNIENRAYVDLINNPLYKQLSTGKIYSATVDHIVKFVTIVGEDGLINTYDYCLDAISARGYTLLETLRLDNMLGYKGQSLIVIFGEAKL